MDFFGRFFLIHCDNKIRAECKNFQDFGFKKQFELFPLISGEIFKDFKVCCSFLDRIVSFGMIEKVFVKRVGSKLHQDSICELYSNSIRNCYVRICSVDSSLELIDEIPKNICSIIRSTKFQPSLGDGYRNFFIFLEEFIRNCWRIKHYFVKNHLIGILCGVVIDSRESTFSNQDVKYLVLRYCFSIISYLYFCSRRKDKVLTKFSIVTPEYHETIFRPTIPQTDCVLLFTPEFLSYGMNFLHGRQIVIHYCWNDIEKCKGLGKYILEEMSTMQIIQNPDTYAKTFFEMGEKYSKLMLILDEHAKLDPSPVKFMIDMFLEHIEAYQEFKEYTLINVKYIAKLGATWNVVRKYLVENSRILEYICQKWKWKLVLPKPPQKSEDEIFLENLKKNKKIEKKEDFDLRNTFLTCLDINNKCDFVVVKLRNMKLGVYEFLVICK